MSPERESRPATTPGGDPQKEHSQPIAADETAEWNAAVGVLSECERAPYDEPHVYADLHGSWVS